MEATTEMKDQFVSFCEEKYGKDKTRKATMFGTAVAVVSFVIATMSYLALAKDKSRSANPEKTTNDILEGEEI